jgi:GNAT superfamily N-acetyltransferase
MGTMLIRKSSVQDAGAIALVHVLSWQCAYRGIIPDSVLDGLSVPRREEQWRKRLAAEAGQTLVAENGSGIIGFADFGCSRDDDATSATAELYAVYVAADRWRRGCGSLLLAGAERALKERLFASITLWVLSDNQRGRCFYEHHGFRADGASKVEVFAGTELTEVRYCKRL